MDSTESDLQRGIKLAHEYGLGRNRLIERGETMKLGPFPIPGAFIKRVGYRGFLSMVWMLFKCNRNAKRNGVRYRYTIDLPLRWFK